MWLLETITTALYYVYRSFMDLANSARSIPLIGDWCAGKFEDIGWWIYDIRAWVYEVGYWFNDVRSYLYDILSWDAIRLKIETTFFGGEHPQDWFFDRFWDLIDSYLPWIRSPEWQVWVWVRYRVEDLINALVPTATTITSWFWGFVDTYFPWLRDPQTAVNSWINTYVDTYFPWLRDPEITVWDWVKARLDTYLPDLSAITSDPAGWIASKLQGALVIFLGIAGWPLLRAIEAYLVRIWDEPEEEG